MNHAMWEHPATQANLATLRDRGVAVVAPGVGALATKHEWGVGRLAEPAELLAAVEAVVPAGRAALGRAARARDRGRHARADRQRALRRQPLVRAHGLRARRRGRGAAAPTSPSWRRTSRSRATRACATSTSTPRRSCRRRAEAAFDAADVLLMAAAVADFRPPAAAPEKLKKAGRDGLRLDARARRPTCSRRWARAAARARRSSASRPSTGPTRWTRRASKRERKRLDAVVLNDISRKDIGFDGVHNEVTIVTEDGERRVPRAAKGEVARAILAAVTELRAGAAGEART